MLTEILVEALSNMDSNTLSRVLESCSAEELTFIDEAMEATATMTSKDKEDFNTIERIQRKARSGGWGSVPKSDRDTFVKIMSNTDNLKVLKKAKSLGEREASHDDKVKGALRSLGLTAGGTAIGAGIGGALGTIKGQNAALAQNARDFDDINSKIGDYNKKVDIINRFNKSQGTKFNEYGRQVRTSRGTVNSLLGYSYTDAPTTSEVPSVTTTVLYNDAKNSIDATKNNINDTLTNVNDKIKDATGIDGNKIKNTFDTWISDANSWLKNNTGFDSEKTVNSIKDATSGLISSGKDAIDNGINAVHTATGPVATAPVGPMIDAKYIKAAQNVNRAIKNMPNSTIIDVPRMGQYTPNGIRELIMTSAKTGAVRGAGVGALTGAGLSAILAAAKKAKRYNKDTRDVMAQGDAMHPDKQWKLNRKNNYK